MNSVRDFILEKQIEFNKNNYDDVFCIEKINRINNLKEKFMNKEFVLNQNELEEIKMIGLEKGGFMNNDNRKLFYSLIFNSCNTGDKINSNYETNSGKIGIYSEILKQDCNRSILHSIFDDENIKLKLKIDLELFSNNFFDNNVNQFEYYQGFQEVCLYCLIFDQNDLLQNLSQFYFSPFLDKNNKIEFDIVLNILSDLLEEIDTNINNALLEITNTPPFYALSWIITWFTHKNKNVPLQYRIFDYLICSDPFTIFYLVAIVKIK